MELEDDRVKEKSKNGDWGQYREGFFNSLKA